MTSDDLRAWIAARGWTAYRLARELNNTPEQTVRDWLGGTRVPRYLPLALETLDRRRLATGPAIEKGRRL